MEKELEALLAIASDANEDEFTMALHANLLTVRIEKGDPEAAAQLRHLLPVIASRLGSAHYLTRQVRENLVHLVQRGGQAALAGDDGVE